MLTLINIVDYLLGVLKVFIIIQIALSLLVAFNVINTYNPTVKGFINGLERLLEPLYRPFRRLLPDFGGLDLSPMVVFLLINIVQIFLLPEARLLVAPVAVPGTVVVG